MINNIDMSIEITKKLEYQIYSFRSIVIKYSNFEHLGLFRDFFLI